MASALREVFIVDGARTPFLKVQGEFGPFSAGDLAVAAGRALLMRQPFTPKVLDEVVLGCVLPSENEANIGRIAALRLNCGDAVPGLTIQRNCGSGMQAIDYAATRIALGTHDLVLAGGTEAMSHAPWLLKPLLINWLVRWKKAKTFKQRSQLLLQLRPAWLSPIIGLICGLRDPLVGMNMGETAEELAYQSGIERSHMDEFAYQSHCKLAASYDQGVMQEEIVPLIDGKGVVYDYDTGLRHDTSPEKLATLPPTFDRVFGSVTPGNSSQITDGAAMLLLASEKAVTKYQLPVVAKIVTTHWAGLAAQVMGLGPVFATTPLMQQQRLALNDIDYWEINEAFAGQVLSCLKAWNDQAFCQQHFGLAKPLGEIDTTRLNIDGGAVALGHPIGASGARIVLHLANVLVRKKAKRGIAAICIGGGQGGALLLENPNA